MINLLLLFLLLLLLVLLQTTTTSTIPNQPYASYYKKLGVPTRFYRTKGALCFSNYLYGINSTTGTEELAPTQQYSHKRGHFLRFHRYKHTAAMKVPGIKDGNTMISIEVLLDLSSEDSYYTAHEEDANESFQTASGEVDSPASAPNNNNNNNNGDITGMIVAATTTASSAVAVAVAIKVEVDPPPVSISKDIPSSNKRMDSKLPVASGPSPLPSHPPQPIDTVAAGPVQVPVQGGQPQQNNTNVVLFRFWTNLPVSIRVEILNFIGDDTKQEELREFVLLSKAWNGDCKENGIIWKVVPLFILSPLYDKTNGGSPITFLRALFSYQLDDVTNRKIQRYRRMIVNGINKFGEFIPYGEVIPYIESRRLTKNLQMDRIESLTISLPSPTMTPFSNIFPYALSDILPNLHELDATNVNMGGLALKSFVEKCPYLEQITWNNVVLKSRVHLTGEEMQAGNNLKQITMENCTFYGISGTLSQISDFNNHPNKFIFHKCCQVLERLSIRNARYLNDGDIPIEYTIQKALIKLVRNAPSSLKWLRSDLTQTNIDMLHKERPDIELLN